MYIKGCEEVIFKNIYFCKHDIKDIKMLEIEKRLSQHMGISSLSSYGMMKLYVKEKIRDQDSNSYLAEFILLDN